MHALEEALTMTQTDPGSQPVTPTAPSERIVSLDVLRGFAIIGILLVNIQIFSMIFVSLYNPTAFGDLTGLNYAAAVFTYVFGEFKFMALFSLLYGAGIVLMTENVVKKGKKPAGIHYRRMLWLLLFGLLHAYILYYGDILVRYAICGMLLYPVRKISPKKLVVLGLFMLLVGSAIHLSTQLPNQDLPPETLEQINKSWQPDEEAIAEELDVFLGGWWKQMEVRVPFALSIQTESSVGFAMWKVMGMMFIGMALFKWGVLSGKKSMAFYRNMFIIFASIGLPMEFLRWILNAQHDWSFPFVMLQGFQINYWGSVFLCLAYVALIIMICKVGVLSLITRGFAAMGRMALTNYLAHSIICMFLFYGNGFGLMGKVSRVEQLLMVLLIVVLQGWYSTIWLRHFRFGPAEWAWRSLTYRKLLPMKK